MYIPYLKLNILLCSIIWGLHNNMYIRLFTNYTYFSVNPTGFRLYIVHFAVDRAGVNSASYQPVHIWSHLVDTVIEVFESLVGEVACSNRLLNRKDIVCFNFDKAFVQINLS